MSSHEVRWGNGTAAEIAKRFDGHMERAEQKASDPAALAAVMLSLLRFYDRQTHAPMDASTVNAFKRTVRDRLAPFAVQIAHYATCIGIDAEEARDEDEVEELCRKRSALQIILDDFAELASKIPVGLIAQIDSELRRACEENPVTDSDAAPHGITSAHWWWTIPTTSVAS